MINVKEATIQKLQNIFIKISPYVVIQYDDKKYETRPYHMGGRTPFWD